MTRSCSGRWVVRSMLFVPGHIPRMIDKAAGAGADCVALDLEDAVPPASKSEARRVIRSALQGGQFDRQAVIVRVNGFDTGGTAEDVAGVACAELDGFVYAMTRNRGEIHAMDRLLSEQEQVLGLPAGHFALVPLIETVEGVLNAAQSQHGQNLVVGTLVFSLVVGMTVPDISGHAVANLEYSGVKHLAPVFHGDTLYARSHILDKRESRSKPDRLIAASSGLRRLPQTSMARMCFPSSEQS